MVQLASYEQKEGKEDFVYCILNPEPLIKGKITNLCTDGKTKPVLCR